MKRNWKIKVKVCCLCFLSSDTAYLCPNSTMGCSAREFTYQTNQKAVVGWVDISLFTFFYIFETHLGTWMFFHKTPNCFFTCLYLSICLSFEELITVIMCGWFSSYSSFSSTAPNTTHHGILWLLYYFIFQQYLFWMWWDIMVRYYCCVTNRSHFLCLPACPPPNHTSHTVYMYLYIYFCLITKWHSCEMFWIFNDNKTHFGCFHILLSNSSSNTISPFLGLE